MVLNLCYIASPPQSTYVLSYGERADVPRSRKKKSIIVVDDDRDFADMMLTMLTQLGYFVTACDSPRVALHLVSRGPELFDAAIVDEIMPAMKGTELAIELLRIKDDMPVILVTGYGNLIPVDRVRAAGLRAALTKPLLKKDIRKVLSDVLAKGA